MSAEQVVRPTGLMDPEVEVRPATGQVEDLYRECREVTAKGQRVLVTTMTKKMAEELTKYFKELGLKAEYLHSDIETLERVKILRDLRKGTIDVLVGVNLLREGLDLPEVSRVAVLDADKEGFLRSRGALIQTMGRAARNVEGKAILYADRVTEAMRLALAETAPAPGEAGRLQRGARHHAPEHRQEPGQHPLQRLRVDYYGVPDVAEAPGDYLDAERPAPADRRAREADVRRRRGPALRRRRGVQGQDPRPAREDHQELKELTTNAQRSQRKSTERAHHQDTKAPRYEATEKKGGRLAPALRCFC